MASRLKFDVIVVVGGPDKRISGYTYFVDEPKFRKIAFEAIPKDNQGKTAVDLYVHLPAANKYIRFIMAGDEIDARKVEALRQHPVPEFFQREDLAVEPPPLEQPLPPDFNKESLGKALSTELKDVLIYIKGDGADSGVAVKRFEGMSDKLVGAIAPDIKALSAHLRKQTQFLGLMADSAAISTMAIICAYANGFDSKKSYRELSYATLVMDLSLSEFTEDQLLLWYKDRESLPPAVLREMMMHPMNSYQIAEQKLKTLSDITMQLILTHHELANGKGFPRQIRTEALFPIARVLSLAVDLYEYMKKYELNGGKPGMVDILMEFLDEPVEAHLRRHNRKLVDKVIKFLAGAEPSK